MYVVGTSPSDLGGHTDMKSAARAHMQRVFLSRQNLSDMVIFSLGDLLSSLHLVIVLWIGASGMGHVCVGGCLEYFQRLSIHEARTTSRNSGDQAFITFR